MRYFRIVLTLFILLGIMIQPLWAANQAKPKPQALSGQPAVIYLYGATESDRSFVDAARAGVERATKELKLSIFERRVTPNENIYDVIKEVADKGASPLIAVGYQNVMPVLNLAERYPHTRFTVIDGLVPPLYPNVQSIIFRDHEGAFLVGMIAAKTSRNSHIGFIGGMDIPLIRNFSVGYIQGARYADPAVLVDMDFVGDKPDAWSNPSKAHDLAVKQYENGADVIFAAAGGSSIGVLQAAKATGQYGIGVDSNQNGLFPGHVLTSLVKRVDIAVYDTLKTSSENRWSPGIKYLGIREGTLDYAVDQHNRQLISETLIDQVAAAKERIINGTIQVEIYSPR